MSGFWVITISKVSHHYLLYYGSSYQCHSFQDRGPHFHCLYGLMFLALLLS